MKPLSLSAIVLWLVATSLSHAVMAPANASELYRWTEPDGSITFSPRPPPAGISFVRVDEADPAGTALAPPATASTQAPRPATPTVTSQPSQLIYAPPPLGGALSGRDAGGDERSTRAAPSSAPEGVWADGAGARQRDERCRELEKRVISLERRLSTPLSPDDMDNTVLYMARYQQNVDRHCR